jgi:PPOX class probable F420-dependent enzyme
MDKFPQEKQQFIDDFLSAAHIARMATADKQGQPHVVPVWYAWDGESIWISAYSDTRKVRELRKNPLISIVIDIAADSDHATAVILEGKAELLHEPREFIEMKFFWIYERYLGAEGIIGKRPQEWIEDPLNTLIKLTPQKIITWDW